MGRYLRTIGMGHLRPGYKVHLPPLAQHLKRIYHKNLISLARYCNDKIDLAHVYEYMLEGNLQDPLRDEYCVFSKEKCVIKRGCWLKSMNFSIACLHIATSEIKAPAFSYNLHQLASHGLFDVYVKATSDTIHDHHSNEDIALAIGMALLQALGDRKGINRFGHFTTPLDEATVEVILVCKDDHLLHLHAMNAQFSATSILDRIDTQTK